MFVLANIKLSVTDIPGGDQSFDLDALEISLSATWETCDIPFSLCTNPKKTVVLSSPVLIDTFLSALVKHIVGELKHLSKNVPQRFLAGFAIDSLS